ncbi:MAG: hypothetical protein OEW99_13480 [Gammaproteobacteria bacterium]|nr:hypothetical protein [Gammaproteobacteria bacterium]
MLKNLPIFILSIIFVLPVRAEMIGEIILGNVNTSDASVSASYTCFFCATESATRNISFEQSGYAGARYIYWSERQPWIGGGFEIGTFSADEGSTIDINVISLSVQGFMRKSLFISDAYPYGRLQPYMGLGVFMFSGSANVDFTPDISTQLDVDGHGTGAGIMAGMRWLFTERTALLLEARSSKVSMNFDNEDFWSFNNESVNAKLSSVYYLLGLSVKF